MPGAAQPTYRLVEGTLHDGALVATKTLYEGPDLASTVTGRAEGTYAYQVAVVGAAGPRWSASCHVEVAPPSLGLAFGLMAIGLLVVLATITLIVRGHRAHRRGEIG